MNTKAHSFAPTPDGRLALRKAFGRFGTGVTVITAHTPVGPLGMTANSFSSISLDPALVLWSPARNSMRHDAFVGAQHFCIHVLCSDQLDVARHFATSGTDFSGLDWRETPSGVPRIAGGLAEFHCETYAVHPAGDHSLILGKVQRVVDHQLDRPGLLFEGGVFGRFAPFQNPA